MIDKMGNQIPEPDNYPDKMGNKLPKWEKRAKEEFNKFRRGQIDPYFAKQIGKNLTKKD